MSTANQKQALIRCISSAMLQADPVLDVLRRLSPDVRFDNDQIRTVLFRGVLKR